MDFRDSLTLLVLMLLMLAIGYLVSLHDKERMKQALEEVLLEYSATVQVIEE